MGVMTMSLSERWYPVNVGFPGSKVDEVGMRAASYYALATDDDEGLTVFRGDVEAARGFEYILVRNKDEEYVIVKRSFKYGEIKDEIEAQKHLSWAEVKARNNEDNV